jgi:hypothetical protein
MLIYNLVFNSDINAMSIILFVYNLTKLKASVLKKTD